VPLVFTDLQDDVEVAHTLAGTRVVQGKSLARGGSSSK